MPRPFIATFLGFLAFFVAFFWPAEFGRLMASGDGFVESVPAFLGPHNLWEPTMLLGYPLFADPNQQLWYPLAWLHLLPHAFNAFAVAPFILAASGMAGFVRALTRSTQAGVVSGLIYALGGFMISHAGHLMLTHPAAWAPFVLWGLESMRGRGDGLPVVATALAVGLCGLAGQPQLLVFAATLAAAYALVSASGAAYGARRFLLQATVALILGFALAATQLLPEALLARDSTRASLNFDAFTAFEVPANQVALRLVFPYFLGTSTLAWYPFSRLYLGTFTEETITVGLVGLTLALLAIRSVGQDRRVAFWYAVALSALVLAIGDAAPVARIMHRLPMYNLFRAPGRHAFELTFAIAVLSGYGSAAVARGRTHSRHLVLAMGLVTMLAAAAYVQLLTGHPPVLEQSARAYGADATSIASPIANGAVGIPLATGFVGFALLWVAARIWRSRAAAVLVVLAVAIDVGTFGWSAYWHWGAVSDRETKAPAWAASLGTRARATHTRIAWLPGVLGSGMQPNLTTLWNVPVIGGYTPLVPRRTQELLGVTAAGGTMPPDLDDAGLDLAGAAIVATNAEASAPVTAAQPFANADLHAFIGPPSEAVASHAAFGLPALVGATRVALVSELGNAPTIPDDARVAVLDVTDIAGHRESHAIIAGRDTAEFAYDRADVRPLVRHRRAPIFSGDAMTHRYVSSFTVATRSPIARVDIRWTYLDATVGALTIEKLSLVDDLHGTAVAYGTFAAFYAAPEHWRPIAIDPAILAFENLRVMPRAWFGTPVASDETSAVKAIRGGRLRTGARFDERRDVMIGAVGSGIASMAAGASVHVVEDEPARQTFMTSCTHACFLVIRDAFDPEWRVAIDSRVGRIVLADIALRGIALPPGTHRVTLTFVPTSLYAGIATTSIAVLCLLFLAYRSNVMQKRGPA